VRLLSPRRSASPAKLEPLSPQRKWRAITIATLVLVPAFWAMLIGLADHLAERRLERAAPGG
jgi:hypothetical protein